MLSTPLVFNGYISYYLLFPRPRKNPVQDSSRDFVCPIILKQSNPSLEQEEGNTDEEVDECNKDILRIGKNL